ncbi:hypothetical protein PILCRDRAFT_175997 [Piloderma croceum F 1598]|uniref:Uncharacterized protein n=1 Tax=Piloderma croceum (strain F 1598) TaxID=765440 RepID=A0A0C3G1R7_PILCF|nr:hypothetical protein PILCRDRAFT_175997 [Piloderma croceum F 1598]
MCVSMRWHFVSTQGYGTPTFVVFATAEAKSPLLLVSWQLAGNPADGSAPRSNSIIYACAWHKNI